MQKIRAMATTGLALIAVAGVVCWFLTYQLTNKHHDHGYLFGLAWAISVLAITCGTALMISIQVGVFNVKATREATLGQKRREVFLESFFGGGAALLLCGLAVLAIITAVAGDHHYDSMTSNKVSWFDSILLATTVVAWAAGIISSMLVNLVLHGMDSWIGLPEYEAWDLRQYGRVR
jgi:hypothetical protein